MQQLGKRNTYTPIDTSLVCSSVSLSLNREETLSEQTSKTSPNNLEENQQSGMTEQNLRVFVLNMRGQPLMPTTPRKARALLKKEKAVVVSCKPFTIQLTIATGETKQEITLGLDTGSKTMGYSAITYKKEMLCGEINLRTDVSCKLTERRMYRRNRRNKLWYREPRFNNRKREEGWLAPSIQHKLDTHKRLISQIKTFLPITKTVIEVAQFDTQKLQNVDIEGVEYQQGQMSGYNNLRAFIFTRDKYTCQICKKKGGIFETHHIIQRKDGGSNRPDNLVTLHLKCHKDFHSGKIKHMFTKPKSYRDTTVMNNIWSRVVNVLGAEPTFGYITKTKRLEIGLEKSHYNDAFIISGGEKQTRSKPIISKQMRRNNRCLQLNRKGFSPSIRRRKYSIQPNDVVSYQGKDYLTKGSHHKGKRAIIIFDGKNKSVDVKNLEVKSFGKGLVINTRQFLTTLKDGVSLAQT